MTQARELKLGRIKSAPDQRDLRATKYIRPTAPEPPAAFNVATRVTSWQMFLNDKLGDCTAAGIAHLKQAQAAAARGRKVSITNVEVLSLYEATGGYVPGDPSTDNGANERDVLKYLTSHSLGGSTIEAFVAVDLLSSVTSVTQMRTIKQALWLFGGLYLGLDLPLTAQTQIANGQEWDVSSGKDAAPDSWGGHAVNASAFDESGMTVVTWGRTQRMTWSFLSQYCSEIWAVLDPDWFNAGTSPQGLDLVTLRSDLAAVKAA